MTLDRVVHVALAVVATGLALTLHEAAHGYAAWALGDDTAKRAGRLTLNPLRHLDRTGSIIVPAVLVLGQMLLLGHIGFMFGWAKPVPVAAARFRYPRQEMAMVAAAGPATNFGLAWLGAASLWLLPSLPPGWQPLAAAFLHYFILTNVVLCLFNLLPIPPLDGGRIVVGMLPLRLARFWARLERSGIALVMLAIFVLPSLSSFVGYPIDPVNGFLRQVVPWAIRLIFTMAGQSV
ncbi:site-2 protease family protein [Acidisoma sp. C75]